MIKFSHILPRTLATITRHDRYQVKVERDFEWSDKSWTHNMFRVFELVFGRRYGIRANVSSWVYLDEDGITYSRQVAHSFEGSLSLLETWIRSKMYFRVLYRIQILQLAPTGFGSPFGLPYVFAIADDGNDNGAASTRNGHTISFSHTCTGSNLILNAGTDTSGGTAAPSSMTYNSVSMGSSQKDQTSGNQMSSMFILSNPATGANTLAGTANSSNGFIINAVSLTGVAASPIGANGAGTANSTNTSVTVNPTLAANSWLVYHVGFNADLAATNRSVIGSTVDRVATNSDATTGVSAAFATLPTTTTGSYSVGYVVNSGVWFAVAIEVKAFVAATNGNFLVFF